MKKDKHKEESSGLTPAQRKLPPKLQAAILKNKKGQKHMDADDADLENPEQADLDDDGELSSYEKKRGKAIEDAMEESKKNCGMYMDKDDDVENEDKADLDKDGKLSSYEKARGKAIEKSMKKGKKCSCGCDSAEDCTCGDKKESRWPGLSLPNFNEWMKWRTNLQEADDTSVGGANQGIFGVTGDEGHPYAPRRGPDVYYTGGHSDEQIQALFQKAKQALADIQDYAQAMAGKGDLAPMHALDAFYEGLAKGPKGLGAKHAAGLGAFPKTGYIPRS